MIQWDGLEAKKEDEFLILRQKVEEQLIPELWLMLQNEKMHLKDVWKKELRMV